MKKIFTLFVAALCSAAMMADVYSVAGSPASLFGAEWDEQSTATEMTLVESHYEWTAQNVYLPAGKVEYKVILNHDWATSWPVQGNRYSNQLTEGMYNVTIIFHPDTHSMELNAERIGDAPDQSQLEIRLIPGVWDLDGAKFAAISINYIPEGEPDIAAIMQTASCSDWFTLAADGNGYIGYIPADTKTVAFGRMSPDTPAPTIENIMSQDGYLWNHSDLLALDPSMKYTIDGWAAEGKDYCPGHWGDQVAPEQGSEYYVAGTMTNWAVNANYSMSANPNADGEYMLTAHLAPTDMFKVAKSEDGRNIITWYPDGMENSYGEHGEITEEGDYTIYFRPAGNVEGWFYGYIYVQKGEQGIDQILMDGKAAKVLRNGQLLIIKGENTYNAQGAVVK